MELSDFYCNSCFWFKQFSSSEEGGCHVNPPTYYGFPKVKKNVYCSKHGRIGKMPPTLAEAIKLYNL